VVSGSKYKISFGALGERERECKSKINRKKIAKRDVVRIKSFSD